MNFKQLNNNFFKLENKLDLFNKQIDWVYFWELVRFSINREILIKKWLITIPHKWVDNKIIYILKNILNLSYKIIFKNPYFSEKESIFIIWHPRRPLIDWYYTDIYTKYLKKWLSKNNIDYQDFENFTQEYIKSKDIESKNILQLDYFSIFSLLFKNRFKFNKKDEKYVKDLELKINNEFWVNIDIYNKVKNEIASFNIFYKHIYKFLKRKRPKIIFEVVSYWLIVRALNKASKELNIPTIELQHGVIDKYHLGYSMWDQKNIKLNYFPDYIFTWWDYWNSVCNYPENTKLISTWFPYFELNKSKYNINKQQEKNIIVISQWAIWEDLSKQVYEVAKELKDYTFYYKLHPWEFHKIDNEFSFLKELENIKIITWAKTVYDLFEICSIQIWAFSTAIYEWLWFWLKTIVFDLPWVEYLDDLVEKDIVKKIDNPSDCIDIIKNKYFWKSNDFESESFFKSKAIDNMLENIKKI